MLTGRCLSSSILGVLTAPLRVSVPSHLPQHTESGLSIEEHANIVTAVSDLADPLITTNKRKKSGKYIQYADEVRARIGKYASENGNERARKHFSVEFPTLNESTIRNFKKMYLSKLSEERKKINPGLVTALPVKSKGRPPLLLELNDKLIKFLKLVRSKGGVVNIHVVRATAEVLIKSNPSLMQHFCRLELRVQSVYRRMGLRRRLGTTGRLPVPRGIYEECRVEYLRNIDH